MTSTEFSRPFRVTGFLLCSLFVLTACVEGAGGGSDSRVAEGGMSGTGISYGRVTEFGSVLVNNTWFDTDDAVIFVNGVELGRGGDLREFLDRGMLVRVEGTWSDGAGEAARVDYEDDLIGPLEAAIEPSVRRMTVLGQSVRFDPQTRFRNEQREGINPVDLNAGDVLQISGWLDGERDIRATYVRRLAEEGQNFRLRGEIRNFDSNARRFSIGRLEIDYDSADLEGLDPEQLRNEVFVEVVGGLDNGADAMRAHVVRTATPDRIRGEPGTEVKFEATVQTAVAEDDTLFANGVQVQIDDGTKFDDIGPGDLVPGMRIDVRGEYNSDGTRVIATDIELAGGDAELEALLDAVEPDDHGTAWLRVSGVRVLVTPATILDEDKRERVLAVADLRRGDFLNIEGSSELGFDGKRYLRAAYIERDDDDDHPLKLEAPVDEDHPSGQDYIKVLGLRMYFDGNTEWDDTEPGRLRAGDPVEVEYRWVGDRAVAVEIELDD